MKIKLKLECEKCGEVTETELDFTEKPSRSCCPTGPKGKRGTKGVAVLNMADDDEWFVEHDSTSERGGV